MTTHQTGGSKSLRPQRGKSVTRGRQSQTFRGGQRLPLFLEYRWLFRLRRSILTPLATLMRTVKLRAINFITGGPYRRDDDRLNEPIPHRLSDLSHQPLPRRSTVATNAPAPAYPIHIHARPSAAVQDAATRLVTAGILGLIRLVDGCYLVPSESFNGAHRVRRTDAEHIACGCKGGARQLHCKHLTVIQFLFGWSAQWPAEQAIKLPAIEPGQTNGAAQAAPAKPYISGAWGALNRETEIGDAGDQEPEPATTPIVVDKNMLAIPGTPFGVTRSTWELVFATFGSNDETTRILLSQLEKTVALGNGHCSCCGQELEECGTRSAICRQCGLVTPRKEDQRAA